MPCKTVQGACLKASGVIALTIGAAFGGNYLWEKSQEVAPRIPFPTDHNISSWFWVAQNDVTQDNRITDAASYTAAGMQITPV